MGVGYAAMTELMTKRVEVNRVSIQSVANTVKVRGLTCEIWTQASPGNVAKQDVTLRFLLRRPEVKYAGYLQRQREEIERQRHHEHTAIPADFDYDTVRGLSAEVLLKLKRSQPATVGQAARVSGITPAAISLLLVHLKRRRAA